MVDSPHERATIAESVNMSWSHHVKCWVVSADFSFGKAVYTEESSLAKWCFDSCAEDHFFTQWHLEEYAPLSIQMWQYFIVDENLHLMVFSC